MSELCIRRPVATILTMVLFLLAGLLGYRSLPVAAVPRIDVPVIVVSANLSGANPQTMASSVASVLERQLSTVSGIAEMTSSSGVGSTTIVLEFDSNRNIDDAARDVQAALNAAQRRLPKDMSAPPSYRKINPSNQPIVMLTLTSDTMRLSDVDAFAQNNILPRISSLPGVGQAQIFGSQKRAARIRVDLDRLTALGLSLSDVQSAVDKSNDNAPIGTLTQDAHTIVLQATGPLERIEDFGSVIVSWQKNGAPVRIDDVAAVVDGVENEQSATWLNGNRAIMIGVQKQIDANTVEVVDRIRSILPAIQAELPPALDLKIMNDFSRSIRASIDEVEFSLTLAVFLVVGVVFLFLHSARATFIPAVTLPISLIGTFAGMWFLDLSINNISLMALALAVGFVVDDAIVMLENIVRHIEKGQKPFQAALTGSREVGFTIVSMTLSLVAVFIPVFFMEGSTGSMFHEFGLAISMAILISGVVSLTLTPMLCARLLKPGQRTSAAPMPSRLFEQGFAKVARGYEHAVRKVVAMPRVMLSVTAATFVLTVVLFLDMPKSFFPQDDTGLLTASISGADDGAFDVMVEKVKAIAAVVAEDPDVTSVVSTASGGREASGSMFIGLRDKSERNASAAQVMQRILQKLRQTPAVLSGVGIYFRSVSSISSRGGERSRYLYTLRSPSLETLREITPLVETALRKTPGLSDVNSDLQIKAHQLYIVIDREAAASLGLSIAQIRSTLHAAYGTRQISTIYAPQDVYAVILEADPKYANTDDLLRRLTVRSSSGAVVPLDAVAYKRHEAAMESVNHVGQLPAATLSFNLLPGVSLSQAIANINKSVAALDLPPGVSTGFRGDAQQFQQASSSQGLILFAAILVVYIILGILYESFIHPLTILSGLPSAGIGALATLKLAGEDLSVIAMIGIIMLIGIVKKNAIMMIDFAIARRLNGVSAQDAIVEAASLRFRPIMMTTMAAVFGALPIMLGMGEGAELRQPLGIAVVGGLVLSQFLTLFITPVVYLMFDRLESRWRKTSA